MIPASASIVEAIGEFSLVIDASTCRAIPTATVEPARITELACPCAIW